MLNINQNFKNITNFVWSLYNGNDCFLGKEIKLFEFKLSSLLLKYYFNLRTMKMAFKFHDYDHDHDHDHDHDFPDLVVVQGAVVCDDLAGEECHADDEQQERVQRGARDKQT